MDVALTPSMTAIDGTIDEDARLLRAFAERGDREALAELLRRHLDSCWRLALRLSGNAADAEDVLQESTLIAMRQARRWRGGNVRAWLLGIVANAQRDLARSARRRERRERVLPPQQPEPTGDDELREAAVAALTELPDAYRAPVCLRYLEGLDFPDIAAALRLRERTARTRVSRGLERLRALLAPRRAGIAAEGVAALIAAAPTPPIPATASTALMKTAATAPVAAATGAVPLAAAGIAAALVLIAIAAARWWPDDRAPVPRTAAAADAPDTRPEIERTLDLRIDVAFYHRFDVLGLIQNRLPAGRIIPYAWPFTDEHLPWAGATVVGKDLRVRDVLDRACPQLGLSWEVDDGYVLFFKPMRAEDLAADLDIVHQHWKEMLDGPTREASAKYRRAAAERLAWSGDKAALRALLLSLADADDDLVVAAFDGMNAAYGTTWPTRRRGTPYHAFRNDAEVVAAVEKLLRRVDGSASPALLYLSGILRVPGATAALATAAAGDFSAHPISREARHLANMRMAIAVASAEAGATWDADPEVARIASDDVPAVRLACAHAWARAGDPRTVPTLEALWKKTDLSSAEKEALLAATVEAYDACSNRAELIPILAEIVGSPPLADRPAATALARMRDPATIAPMIGLMERPGFFSGDVLFVLESLRLPTEIDALREAARSAPIEVAEQAAGIRVALGDADAVAVLEDFARAYPARAQAEQNYLLRPELPQAEAAAFRLAATIGPSCYAVLATMRSPGVIAFLVRILADPTASAEAREAAKAALWRINDPAALDAAAAAPGGLGYDPRCPAWLDTLAALDAHAQLPHASDYPRSPTRAEAVQRIDRALELSDRHRADGIEATALMLMADPSLPRDLFLWRLRGVLTKDVSTDARGMAAKQFARLSEPADPAAIDTLIATITHDGDSHVRNAGREALMELQRRFEALYALDLAHLGTIPPDESLRLKIQEAVSGPRQGEFDLPQPPAKTKPDF